MAGRAGRAVRCSRPEEDPGRSGEGASGRTGTAGMIRSGHSRAAVIARGPRRACGLAQAEAGLLLGDVDGAQEPDQGPQAAGQHELGGTGYGGIPRGVSVSAKNSGMRPTVAPPVGEQIRETWDI